MIATAELLGDGLGVALPTPYAQDGAIDLPQLAGIVGRVVGGGTDFVVALGSTGEASMLDDREREHALATIRTACGDKPLVVGCGASSTRQAASWAEQARDHGADAVLVAVPPYTKPTQAGIVQHFQSLAATLGHTLPIIAYDVPSRTGTRLTSQTVAELWQIDGLVALKESSGDLTRIAETLSIMPDDRVLLAGDDALTLPTIAVGGFGVISVAANAIPEEMRALVTAARAGDLEDARNLHRRLMPFFLALQREPNPIPIKAALALQCLGSASPRLPLLPATDATRQELQRTLSQLEGVSLDA
ncbi:MAG: 4-hydroxy-tetrahydrodipicolinate synthase [Planctomycetota bacterium]